MNTLKTRMMRIASPALTTLMLFALLAANSINILAATASISLSKNSGPPGTQVTVSGSNFDANATGIYIQFNSVNVATGISANASGAWTRAISIPAVPANIYAVLAGVTTPTAPVYFTVIPAVTLSLSNGGSGTAVTVTGGGFAAGETGIVVTFDNNPVTSNITASVNGSWTSILTIPASTAGIHTIGAYGSVTSAGAVTTATFTVGAAVNLNKTSGPVGTSVIVNGSGFAASESGIVLTFDNNPVTSNIVAGANGSWTTNLNIPASASGSHSIGAYGSSTVASAVTPAIFTVNAAITLNKSTGAAGSSVTVTGSGFAANENNIIITFDSNIVTSNITANASGSWTSNLTIPASAAGAHTVGAYGIITAANSVTPATFTVGAAVTLNKSTGPVGTVVTVTGSGFAASETGITVTFDNATLSSSISANASGSWTANITIPASTAGVHAIGAFGSTTAAGTVTTAAFTIGAAVNINKSSGAAGTIVTVSGSGFAASETGITLSFDNNPVISNITANPSGSWTSNLTIPASAAGAHTIGASGSITSNGATSTFTVTPGISLNKSTGPAGTVVTVSGSGFSASESGIIVTFDNTLTTANITANANGAWTANLTIPASTAGTHTIGAYGSVTASAATSTFTITAGISLSKSSGAAGTTITVNGSGFSAGETGITITFDTNAAVSNISAGSAGSWTSSLTVPVSAAGVHSIGAYGSTTGAGSVTPAIFTVGASITVNKSTGAAGSAVTVNGSGFSSGETGIAISFDNNVITSNISANANGSWTASLTIPAAASGMHTISASSPSTPASAATQAGFSTSNNAVISPTTGYVGSTVHITGNGFAPNSPLNITYDDTAIEAGGATTDATGNINQSITIPVSKAGTHTINIADSQGNLAKTSFVISNTPPPVPVLTAPRTGTTIGLIGNAKPTFVWTAVSDANGVSYELQVGMTSDFSELVVDKTNLQSTRYTLDASQALPRGEYYWRVKAIDKASNESPWSDASALKSGMISMGLLVLLIALAVVIVFILLFAITRPTRREAITVHEVEEPRYSPGQWPALDREETARERPTPVRLALPELSKSSAAPPTADQTRLKIITEFAQSIPLPEADYSMNWLLSLVENQIQVPLSLPVYEQLLRGEIKVHYEPSWSHHPIYRDLAGMPQRQPVVQKLSVFISDVDHCATDAMAIIQQIYRESGADSNPDFLRNGGWSYVTAVYVDAINWYAGKSLRDPSDKDYVVEMPGDPEVAPSKRWISGDRSTLFAGHLVLADDENEALRLRNLHLKLRRAYRNNEKARHVSSVITHLQIQRNELLGMFNNIGRI